MYLTKECSFTSVELINSFLHIMKVRSRKNWTKKSYDFNFKEIFFSLIVLLF